MTAAAWTGTEKLELGSPRRCRPIVVQEGCEFLVAQGSDGRLNLDDVYVYDQESGIYARPDKVGDMPPGPRLFQQVHTFDWSSGHRGRHCRRQGLPQTHTAAMLTQASTSVMKIYVLCEQVPWRHESTGDTVYAKDPVEQVPAACTALGCASDASRTRIR